jgi:hypothetical protein
MKIYLILIVAILALGGLSCSSQMPADDQVTFNANVERIDWLQKENLRIRTELTDGQAIDAEKLLAMNAALINSYIEMDALLASNKALAEKTGTPEWMVLAEAVAASLLGVRFIRGGASKGVLANVPILGNGSSTNTI